MLQWKSAKVLSRRNYEQRENLALDLFAVILYFWEWSRAKVSIKGPYVRLVFNFNGEL